MSISQIMFVGTVVFFALLLAAVVAAIARHSGPARLLDDEEMRAQRRLVGLAMGGFPLAELHDRTASQASPPRSSSDAPLTSED